MTRQRTVIDITEDSHLRRIAEDARRKREPAILRAGEEDVAILVPIPATMRGRTQANFEDALSAFGSWSEVDTEQFQQDRAAARGPGRSAEIA
jgi:hypothetical protein